MIVEIAKLLKANCEDLRGQITSELKNSGVFVECQLTIERLEVNSNTAFLNTMFDDTRYDVKDVMQEQQ